MHDIRIIPSILSADFSSLGTAVDLALGSGARAIHADVMDGSFVPEITFGAGMVKALSALGPSAGAVLSGEKEARAGRNPRIDAHLMTVTPEKHLDAFAKAGAASFTFHVEACCLAHRLAGAIRERGMEAGVSLVPVTPVAAVASLLPAVDIVLVMTVDPGYGGQAFIEGCLDKIAELAAIRERKGLSFRIMVDGGVNEKTVPALVRAGAEELVAGSALYGAADFATAFRSLGSLAKASAATAAPGSCR